MRLFEGVPCPLVGKEPGDIDFLVVRENVEGEYSSIGGIQYEGMDHEAATQLSIFTRFGVDRILRYAFDLARHRPARQHRNVEHDVGLFLQHRRFEL